LTIPFKLQLRLSVQDWTLQNLVTLHNSNGHEISKNLPTLLNGTPCFSGWVKRRFSLNGGKQTQKYETPQESTKYKYRFSYITQEATLESKILVAKWLCNKPCNITRTRRGFCGKNTELQACALWWRWQQQEQVLCLLVKFFPKTPFFSPLVLPVCVCFIWTLFYKYEFLAMNSIYVFLSYKCIFQLRNLTVHIEITAL
jgi:hypothetical protein